MMWELTSMMFCVVTPGSRITRSPVFKVASRCAFIGAWSAIRGATLYTEHQKCIPFQGSGTHEALIIPVPSARMKIEMQNGMSAWPPCMILGRPAGCGLIRLSRGVMRTSVLTDK